VPHSTDISKATPIVIRDIAALHCASNPHMTHSGPWNQVQQWNDIEMLASARTTP
jgi:hypothetical protein